MQGVMLAAGISLRLQPISLAIPKCLMPVGWNTDGRTELLIEKLVGQMKLCGVSQIIVVVGHLKDAIMSFLGDGHRFGVEFVYVYQEQLNGEAGGLFLAKGILRDVFLVADADNYIALPDVYRRLLSRHTQARATVTVGVAPVVDARQYALVKLTDHHTVEDFIEKPEQSRFWNNLAKTGLYVIDRQVLDLDPKHSMSGRGDYNTTTLFHYLIGQGHTVAAEVLDEPYADIGSWAGYRYVLNRFAAASAENIDTRYL